MSAPLYWLVPGGKIVFAPTELLDAPDWFDARFEPDVGLPITFVWAKPLDTALAAARAWRDFRKEAARRFGIIQGGKRDWTTELKQWEF